MKSIIKYLAFAAVCTSTMASCSDSWLKTDPTSSVSGDEIIATTDNAKQAINGICRVMVNQHSYYGQMFNGEGTMKILYGEYPGQDLNFPYMNPGWSPIMNGQMTNNSSSIYDSYPWYYYYIIIGNANTIIAKIENAAGTEEERKFIKAEALTFRAYSFFRITEIYSDSWAKSNNGSTKGAVLRLDESMGDMPQSTLAETYEQIYKDLDDAITLYKESGLSRNDVYASATSSNCFPDLNTAYAIYARVALTKQDYSNAANYAKLAREGYNLMSVADYKAGFAAPTSEWIWSVYNDATETIWYYGWQLFMACNGYYAMNGINVCINRDLIEQFPDSDLRKSLFLTEKTFLSEGESFTDVVAGDEAGSDNGSFIKEGAYNKAAAYTKQTIPAATEQCFAYAALKFQCTAQPAVGCQPIFRASEMVLIEAEANYFLNNEIAAQNALVELNKTSGRDETYTCTKTGADLLNEIKMYRRLELWGEGFSWFDCKRWGDNVIRKGFNEDGNYYSGVAGTYGDKDSFWKWIIPQRESDYNSAINFK
ncbi:RagB/SusD family nutrient uptake outer membrane protein [Bacteroides ilei]|uniref:RagB/SusD family nutrient uptake outer membrane protein n=1 Tax=Bacteroides ilei TaxID=1907658 RepID=UPI0009313557|nr:RagB/SusD family nutrient uptake outer membrane protein [Bacteroides ilei]